MTIWMKMNSMRIMKDKQDVWTEKAVCVVCGVGVYKRTKGGRSCKACNVWTKTSRAVYICDQDNCRDFKCLSCYNSV